MKHYPYVSLGENLPTAPVLPALITPPDWASNSGQYEIEAFLDTGADCTLIPLEVLSVLQLRIVEIDVQISGVGGGQVNGIACYANVQLGEFTFKAIRVYGCQGEQLSQRVLIGRDVLNQCCVEFDGLNSTLTIKSAL
ncbi:MAG: retropepsin-like aspartic protease [Leptolyngbyaceae bacterium]|nr:retropepsin-like aspartic protease [Leptolyngbyaceae bacterium]